MRSLEIFREYDVVLCDIDGVLHTGPQGIEGVPGMLRALEPGGPPLFFLTNNGSALPEQITTYLAQIGLELPTEKLITAGEVLVDDFKEHGLVGQPLLSVGNEPAAEYIRRAGGILIPDAEARKRFREARAVVIGSTRHLNKNAIDAACNAVYLNEVPVICTNPDVFTPTSHGEITMVAGAFANLFERELDVPVRRLGKPHRPIFEMAIRRVREAVGRPTPRVLVVDDNLESGIRGGRDMGFDTMLVLTGWHRSRAGAEEAMQRLDIHPTYVLESVVS